MRRNIAEIISGHATKEVAIPLGDRLFDVSCNWNNAIIDPPSLETVENFLETYQDSQCAVLAEDYHAITLSAEQQRVMDILNQQITEVEGNIKEDDQLAPRRIIVQGKAGCGKSTLLHLMVKRITECCGSDAVMVCAPTGVAALNVNGTTIHSAFSLAISNKPQTELASATLKKFQSKHAGKLWYIMDEFSMIGARRLMNIAERFKEIDP